MTNEQVTENKGKEPSRSDNVVYDYCLPHWHAMYHKGLAAEGRTCEMCNAIPNLSPSPISPSDASLTPADAILRDDEK